MMKKLLIMGIALVAMVSCSKNNVFSDYFETTNLEWLKSEKPSFTFENIDDTSKVDVYLAFRYAQGYQFKNLVMQVEEKTAIGNFTFPLDVAIRNEKGEYIGDVSGDIWDLEVPIKTGVVLPKGTCTYTLQHQMPLDKLHMVMKVGIVIKKSK